MPDSLWVCVPGQPRLFASSVFGAGRGRAAASAVLRRDAGWKVEEGRLSAVRRRPLVVQKSCGQCRAAHATAAWEAPASEASGRATAVRTVIGGFSVPRRSLHLAVTTAAVASRPPAFGPQGAR
jgi:hypothetical protein